MTISTNGTIPKCGDCDAPQSSIWAMIYGRAVFALLQVWHLDVAPSNIMLDENGKGLLIDFHMAQQGHVMGAHTTRRTFMSLSRLRGRPATLSGEVPCFIRCIAAQLGARSG